MWRKLEQTIGKNGQKRKVCFTHFVTRGAAVYALLTQEEKAQLCHWGGGASENPGSGSLDSSSVQALLMGLLFPL